MGTELYFLKRNNGPWEQVDKATWVNVERQAGFVNTMGEPEEPGTGGFSCTRPGFDAAGRIIYTPTDPDRYDWDPEFAAVLKQTLQQEPQ